MTCDESRDVIESLDDLLEAERAALVAGDLDRIAALVDRKEDLFGRMEGTAAETLSVLQDKVARNQVLLDRALEGIREVAARTAELRRVRKSLETYDARGRRLSLPGPGNRAVERRA